MSIKHTIKLLVSHPLTKKQPVRAIIRFLKWQVGASINNCPIIYQYTNKSKLVISKGMTGATGNLYFGLHEFEDMAFLLHFLRKEDLFLDAGANVGSYTVLASAHVGCNSICVEPVPSTFQNLLNNIYINKINERVNSLNIGLGKASATMKFTKTLDTVNHIATESDENTIEVPIESIDEIVDLNIPTLIKMDVEGYETEVLKGAMKTLENSKLKAIIIELNGSGERYGFDEKGIHNLLVGLNFMPYSYYPFERKLKKIDDFGSYNTIYIRDIDFVRNRIEKAENIQLLNSLF